jgi:hypothetical protein
MNIVNSENKKAGEFDLEKDNHADKKQIFTIHEDDDHKVYNYNLDDDEEDDYCEYDENLIKEDEKCLKEENKLIEASDRYREEDNFKSKNQSNVEENKLIPASDSTAESASDIELILENEYDRHSISHRIYIKDSIIDLQDFNFYVKCTKMKKKNKIFSFIGVLKIII